MVLVNFIFSNPLPSPLMQSWWQKILLFVAVATVMGHNCLPHQHHDEVTDGVAHHHHHEEDNGTESSHHEEGTGEHNIFSFAELDGDYIPVKVQKTNICAPLLFLLTPVISYHLNLLREQSKTHFGYYREIPPPDSHLSNLPSRAPPALVIA